jgi:mannose PTS system EIIA component
VVFESARAKAIARFAQTRVLDNPEMSPAGILIIAHAPLASALRTCALHVFPDAAASVVAVDVQPNVRAEESTAMARIAMEGLGTNRVLVLTDMFGATPSNVATRLVDGQQSKLIAGVNFPMLLRAIPARHEPFEVLVNRAVDGAKSGIMAVAASAPQNQARPPVLSVHDQQHRHQQ